MNNLKGLLKPSTGMSAPRPITRSSPRERLVKIESQTRVLTEAVMAITDTVDGVGPTGQAVKDES
jgi:hypothetical protein